MSDQDRDNSRASRRGRDDGDGGGGGGGRAPGKATRSAQGAETAQAPEADPVADFEAALTAGDADAAIAAWDKVPNAKQKKMEKATILQAIRLIGPRSARIMKESGVKPSSDIRVAQEILHNHSTTEWIKELDEAQLVGNFLKAKPVRHQLDQAGLERLADFAGPKAPNNKLAEAAYEKAWGPGKSGKWNDGYWTILGENWNRENCARMYKALLTGGMARAPTRVDLARPKPRRRKSRAEARVAAAKAARVRAARGRASATTFIASSSTGSATAESARRGCQRV